MTANSWTLTQLAVFQNRFGLNDSAVAELLDIDNSTISVWKKRNLSKIPSKYMPVLEAVSFRCNQESERRPKTPNSDLALGPLVASLKKVGYPDAEQDTMGCPFCAEMIKRKAILCKHCHSTLV